MDKCELPLTCLSNGPQETEKVAAQLAALAGPGDLILLSGNLGAGKTHFVRGFCAGLGLEALWEVDSPTYTIVNHYEIGPGVDHIDLYRCTGEADLEEIGFEEMLASSSIKLIEWPQRLETYPLPTPTFIVELKIREPQTRALSIRRPSMEYVS